MNAHICHRNAQARVRLSAAMGLLLGTLLFAGGLALAFGWTPGANGMATGPRIGVGLLLAMIGALMLSLRWVRWAIERRAVPDDYQGRCPVGESCSDCGAFNLKPRISCRSCGGSVNAE